MIPKIIHYCWFGKGNIPDIGLQCIKSWNEQLSDYEIVRWDETNFDVSQNPFTKKAYEEKKYAFVSDYVRLYALLTMGGVYLDIDEIVLRDFSGLLMDRDIVACFETNSSVMMGLLASNKGNSLIREFLKIYNNWDSEDYMANPEIFTKLLITRGLKLNGLYQELENGSIAIYPNEYFCCYDFSVYKEKVTDNSYAMQKYAGTWTNGKSSRSKRMHEKLVNVIGEKRYLLLKKIKKTILG